MANQHNLLPFKAAGEKVDPPDRRDLKGRSQNDDQQFTARPRSQSDGLFGGVQAIDMQSGKTFLKNMRRAPNLSSLLATAGGLIFSSGTKI